MKQSQILIQIRNCPDVDITIDFVNGVPMPVSVQRVQKEEAKESGATPSPKEQDVPQTGVTCSNS